MDSSAGSKKVNWSVIGHQVCEEGRATLVYVLRQPVFKSLDGSIWQLVRKLVLELAQHCSCHTSANVILVHVGVASNLVARNQGRPKYPQSNSPKQLRNMESVLQGLRSNLSCGGVDRNCVVHCMFHPGRGRVNGILMSLLRLLKAKFGVLRSGTVAGHHRLQFCYNGCIS